MKVSRQTTLREDASVTGVGVHSGLPVTLTMRPAEADSGIVFQRVDRDGCVEREIRADVCAVKATEFATVLGDGAGPLCSTAEHVLAALSGLGVDNVLIELDGPEVPIMDGSASDFIAAIDQAGIVTLAESRRYIQVLKPIRVAMGDAFGELSPYSRGFRLDVEIAFSNPLIGRQSIAFDLDPLSFRKEVARARTFGFVKDVQALWDAGYALGANFDNTLVMSDTRVLNAEGLRFEDEFVRHKALDAIGDLALAGAPLLGLYRSFRGGHKLNNAVLTALMADPTAWTFVEAPAARRPRSQPEVSRGLVPALAAAYGPDVL